MFLGAGAAKVRTNPVTWATGALDAAGAIFIRAAAASAFTEMRSGDQLVDESVKLRPAAEIELGFKIGDRSFSRSNDELAVLPNVAEEHEG